MNDIMALGDYLCQVCIDIMYVMADLLGISYGTLNVLLFIILGPASTLIFMASSLIQLICKDRYRKLNIALFTIGSLLVSIVLLLILYTLIVGDFSTR